MGVRTNFDGFDWGFWENHNFKKVMYQEFIELNHYFRVFQPQEGDTILDIGASVGPYSYLSSGVKPKHIYCVEPSPFQIPTLAKNLVGTSSTIIPYGIGNEDGVGKFEVYATKNKEIILPKITFKSLISNYKIGKVDILKTDCEGGEYDIFTPENVWWVKENVGKIVGEFHLGTPELNQKFREFRDVYLRIFPDHDVFALCNTPIKWDLWNEHFLEHYTCVMIHININ